MEQGKDGGAASKGPVDDLVVADDEYPQLSGLFMRVGEDAESKLQAYLEIMAEVCELGISEGEAARNIQAFLGAAAMLGGQFIAIATAAAKHADAYVGDIDAADAQLY